jgi:hypothetical protein
VSDINTAVVDSLKALDPKRPIREADIPTEKHDDLRLSPKPELVVANHDAPPNVRCGFFTGWCLDCSVSSALSVRHVMPAAEQSQAALQSPTVAAGLVSYLLSF